MTITAFPGPVVSFGFANVGSSIPSEYNEEAGPSLFYQGVALADPRPPYNYEPGQKVGQATNGWFGIGHVLAIDAVPTVISTNSIAQTQSSTTATSRTITLTASNTNNVTINQSITNSLNGQLVTGLLAIDGPTGVLTYGSGATIGMWDPAKMISRCVTITSSVNDSGGAYTLAGYDVYSYPMTETIVGPNAATVTTQKAFKYIATITASGTINSTGVYVGVSDKYGIPLYVGGYQHLQVYISSAATISNIVTGSTGVTAGSTRATQTSTTPDVRGTYSSTTASDGTMRLTMYVSPQPLNIQSSTYSIVGATPA